MKTGNILSRYKLPLIFLAVALVGVILLTLDKDEPKESSRSYAESIKKDAEELVKRISGAEAHVTVTLESMSDVQYAKNVKRKENKDGTLEITEEYVTVSGSPLVLYTGEPKIRGITVACKGGDNAALQKKVIEALSCAYGISSARICVVALADT